MIAIEKIENLDGSVAIPTSQLLYFKDSKIVSGSGATITLTGASSGGTSGGGTSGGGTTPTPTRVQDTTLTYTSTAVDAATNNVIEIDQETGQGNFSEYLFTLTQNDFTLTAGTSSTFALTKIQMNVKTAGYQLCKILLYDANDNLITFSRVDADTVQLVSNNATKVDFVSNGFMLITNATYELSNILNTDKMPVAATGGWYALTSATDATAAFTATFSAPVQVAKVRIYRCGAASTSFNGGTDVYTCVFTDSSNVTKSVDVAKVDNTVFTQIDNPTIATLSTAGVMPTVDSKIHKFTLGVSSDGVNFTDISSLGVSTYTQNSTTLAYTAVETFPQTVLPTTTSKLFFKIPDADIAYLKSVKIDMWRIDMV